MTIGIIGGGIAGLTSAIALAKIGHKFKTIVTLELVTNRLLELGNTVHRCIFGLASLERLHHRLLDIFRRIKIGFTGRKTNNIFSGQ